MGHLLIINLHIMMAKDVSKAFICIFGEKLSSEEDIKSKWNTPSHSSQLHCATHLQAHL